MKLTTALVAALLAFPAWSQQFTMKLSCPTVNDMNVEYMKAMKAGIEPKTNGRIKVELYPANQLGQIPRTVEGVALGTIEMTLVASGFFIGMDPRYLVFDAAGLFDDMNHGNRVFQDPEVRKRLSQFSADKGIELLITYAANPNVVVSHKQIRTIDGAVAGLTVFPGFKYYDVAKHMTYLPGSYLILAGGVSRTFMKNIG